MGLLKPLAFFSYKCFQLYLSKHVSWSEKGIVPEIFNNAPANPLTIKYSNVVIKKGAVIPAKYTKEAPKIKWDIKETGTHYSLVMTDLDAPSRQKPFLREWHHWLVGNIPDNNLENGQTLTEYIAAGPPKGTGLHRISSTEYKGRPKFSINTFMKKHQMEMFAGTFFETEYDESVDEVHKQINLGEYLDLTKPQTF